MLYRKNSVTVGVDNTWQQCGLDVSKQYILADRMVYIALYKMETGLYSFAIWNGPCAWRVCAWTPYTDGVQLLVLVGVFGLKYFGSHSAPLLHNHTTALHNQQSTNAWKPTIKLQYATDDNGTWQASRGTPPRHM